MKATFAPRVSIYLHFRRETTPLLPRLGKQEGIDDHIVNIIHLCTKKTLQN